MRLVLTIGRIARVAGLTAAFAVAASTRGASAGDADPAYFSYGTGAAISRMTTGADGRIYLAGWTATTGLPASASHPAPLPPRSGDYPDEPGFLYVAALAPDGHRLWTSYVPVGGDYSDAGIGGIAAGADGSIWLVGYQRIALVQAFQPGDAEVYDGFFAKFSHDGELLVASHISEGNTTWPEDVVIDASGDAFVVGSTAAATFPGAPVDNPDGLDGFVSRIRADGSGVVWTKRFRGGEFRGAGHCGGVARDPASGTIVVSFVGSDASASPPQATTLEAPHGFRAVRDDNPYVLTTIAFRMDGNGGMLAGARLDFLGVAASDQYFATGIRTPIAVAADGTVLIGGAFSIARLSSDLGSVIAASVPSVQALERIAADAQGRVVVVSAPAQQGYEWHQSFGGRLVALGADLEPERLAPVVTHSDVATDLAVDPFGALCLAGAWDGGPFNAPPEAVATDAYSTTTISRVPVDGIRTPSQFGARARGPDVFDLTWSADGDAVAHFELLDESGEPMITLADQVAPTATSFRVTGATPGTLHNVRLVSVFANGVRAQDFATVSTRPVASASVVAVAAGEQRIDVAWDDPNGRSTTYRVQRRIGRGPWVDLAGAATDAPIGQPAVLHDLVPDVADDVAYRVRAFVQGVYPRYIDRYLTSWTVSAPIRPAAALSVTPTSGEFRGSDSNYSAGGRFVVEGRYARLDGGGPVAFDPTTQPLRLVYGEASRPNVFELAAGDAGWTQSGGVWTWNASRTLNPWTSDSEVVIDPAAGTFRVHLDSAAVSMPRTSRSVAVGLVFGELSGGDVRVWRTGRKSYDPLTFPAARRSKRGAR
jgi:hypothetical protein